MHVSYSLEYKNVTNFEQDLHLWSRDLQLDEGIVGIQDKGQRLSMMHWRQQVNTLVYWLLVSNVEGNVFNSGVRPSGYYHVERGDKVPKISDDWVVLCDITIQCWHVIISVMYWFAHQVDTTFAD